MFTIDEDVAWFLGCYNSHSCCERIAFFNMFFDNTEKESAYKAKYILGRIYDYFDISCKRKKNIRLIKRRHKNDYVLTCASRSLANFFDTYVTQQIRIPEAIKYAPHEICISFLNGCFHSRGRLKSNSFEWIIQIQSMCCFSNIDTRFKLYKTYYILQKQCTKHSWFDKFWYNDEKNNLLQHIQKSSYTL